MKQVTIKILRSRYFLMPVILVTAILASVSVYYFRIEDKIIFPNTSNYKYLTYTDASNGGKSHIENYFVTDSVLKVDFKLQEGFQSPYVGISICPLSEGYINAAKYNRVNLSMSGQNINRVGFAFYTPPLANVLVGSKDEAIYHSYLNITHQKETYFIPITELKHPEWWEDLHQLSSSENKHADFNKILHININSAFAPQIEGLKSLEIYRLVLTRDNQPFFMSFIVIWVFVVLLSFFAVYFVLFRKKNKAHITIKYRPLEVDEDSNGTERCIEYINANFHNSELNLEMVTGETGIPKRKITTLINEEFNCNFKTYINRLRISEAKRLLYKSDLNIGEIAYKVGFNNQSHFNRVFRAEMNISPTEYLENQE